MHQNKRGTLKLFIAVHLNLLATNEIINTLYLAFNYTYVLEVYLQSDTKYLLQWYDVFIIRS